MIVRAAQRSSPQEKQLWRVTLSKIEWFHTPRDLSTCSAAYQSKVACVRTGSPLYKPAWNDTATDSQEAFRFAPNAIVGIDLIHLCKLSVSTELTLSSLIAALHIRSAFGSICLAGAIRRFVFLGPHHVLILQLRFLDRSSPPQHYCSSS
jgi:hypothetical protein